MNRTIRFVGIVLNSFKIKSRDFDTTAPEYDIEHEFMKFVQDNNLDVRQSYWFVVRAS